MKTNRASSASELVEEVKLPAGVPAWIHVYRTHRGDVSAYLEFADNKKLPISLGNGARLLTEGMTLARKFINGVYGRTN